MGLSTLDQQTGVQELLWLCWRGLDVYVSLQGDATSSHPLKDVGITFVVCQR